MPSWCEATVRHASPLDALPAHPEDQRSASHFNMHSRAAPARPGRRGCTGARGCLTARPLTPLPSSRPDRVSWGRGRTPQVGPCTPYGKAQRCCGNQGNVLAPTSQHPARGGGSVLTENMASQPHPSSSIPGWSLDWPGAVRSLTLGEGVLKAWTMYSDGLRHSCS